MGATVVLLVVGGLVAGQWHHLVGTAPVMAAMLCSACVLRPRDLAIVGLGGMLLRDLMVGMDGITPFRLLGVAAVVVAVRALRVRPTPRSLLTGLVITSPIFHLALAVGDWVTGTCVVWPKTPQGLVNAVATALPYFQRSFVGDLVLTGAFLMLYALAAYAVVGRRVSTASGSA